MKLYTVKMDIENSKYRINLLLVENDIASYSYYRQLFVLECSRDWSKKQRSRMLAVATGSASSWKRARDRKTKPLGISQASILSSRALLRKTWHTPQMWRQFCQILSASPLHYQHYQQTEQGRNLQSDSLNSLISDSVLRGTGSGF